MKRKNYSSTRDMSDEERRKYYEELELDANVKAHTVNSFLALIALLISILSLIWSVVKVIT